MVERGQVDAVDVDPRVVRGRSPDDDPTGIDPVEIIDVHGAGKRRLEITLRPDG